MLACNGGKKAPVMASQNDEINLNQDASSHVGKVETSKQKVDVEHETGVLKLSEVFEKKADFNGKQITVKGKVTKYNPGIMGKNWVHIQDGTDFKGEYDLTITTLGTVELGSVVTFTGTIALDRDFGYGYKYGIIMENATLVE